MQSTYEGKAYGFDPLVRKYLEQKLIKLQLVGKDRKELYLLFLPLTRDQFIRLFDRIEFTLNQLGETLISPLTLLPMAVT